MSNIQIHCDCQLGLQMDGVKVERVENCGGTFYFKATAKIGCIFGQEVDGEITGIGKTEAIAFQRLAEEQKKLYESLWV
jgi:hypothetical protein